jgi:outer membrane receptor protein involved in Fe transport
LNFNFSKTINNWWEMEGFVGMEYSWFRLDAYGQNRFYNGVNGWIDISNTFYLNKSKTFVAELHAYYYSARQKDYKHWREMSLFDGGVKAMLLDKKLILGLTFEDPFQKAYWDQKNEVNGTEEFSYDNGRLASFSVTYKFGNNSIKSKKERSEGNEEIQRAR